LEITSQASEENLPLSKRGKDKGSKIPRSPSKGKPKKMD
jgi:hypothetical protein